MAKANSTVDNKAKCRELKFINGDGATLPNKDLHPPRSLTMKRPEITVRSIGAPDLDLAAELFAPLFLKIHTRNELNRRALLTLGDAK